ncbi:MAG: DnaJ domain-containing protein [Gammaproteobacteria bacterium]|nr:DnaJ domain-containing protein [Gammaproteobacteria bacterium]HRX70197.1 DnaJ domain-containing protein [Candidatus Competibacteraceae bacterium]
MLARLLVIAAVLIGLYCLIRQFRRSLWGPQLGRIALAVGGLSFLLLLTVRGGAEITLPLLAVLAPWLIRWLKTHSPSLSAPSQTGDSSRSVVTTRFLLMALDHASGVMTGQVREGRFAGRDLVDLTLPELLILWCECQVDSQSVAVLEAYLDRYAGSGWRKRSQGDQHSQSPTNSGAMTLVEAYQILGLSPGASRADIQSAYRRLIQRLHPDHGGTAYLAAQLNRARDLLLTDELD